MNQRLLEATQKGIKNVLKDQRSADVESSGSKKSRICVIAANILSEPLWNFQGLHHS